MITRCQKVMQMSLFLVAFFFIMNMAAVPGEAQLVLTPEERAYITKVGVIRAASIDGAAPIQSIGPQGEIAGISIRVMEDIAKMTGLAFEYRLYSSLEEAERYGYDLFFGVPRQYISSAMFFSEPYLVSESVLYINANYDPSQLADKKYAAIYGSVLPEGVNKDRVLYYSTRQESMNAVEAGEADYGCGNVYSVLYYTMQNNYHHLITIPRSNDMREYCIYMKKENDILLAVLNKAVASIEEEQLQAYIMEEASEVKHKVTVSTLVSDYSWEIIGGILLGVGVLIYSIFIYFYANKKLLLQNKKYEILSETSNECIYEYDLKTREVNLTKKFVREFGEDANLKEVIKILKDESQNISEKGNDYTLTLPRANGTPGVYRVVSTVLNDEDGKAHTIVGKLIDISADIVEKELLLQKSKTDGLTGLYNAVTAKELITEDIRNWTKNKIDALLLIDCDNFKAINDTYGHLIGDKVLVNTSKGLRNSFRVTDIMGRIGGDEFCVYLNNVPSVEFVRKKCRQYSAILEVFNQELSRELGREIDAQVSIGVAVLNEESTFEELFKRADDALYEAKNQGGATVVVDGDPAEMGKG